MTTHHLRILHLSDLHERVALPWMSEDRQAKVRVRAASRRRVLETNFPDILDEIALSRPIDLVCFTGDAADWGLPEEYAEAGARLREILQRVKVDPQRLFVVPGNHDVQRREAADAWQNVRSLAAVNRDGLSDWLAGTPPPYGAAPEWLDQINVRTAAFWGWVKDDLGRADLCPGCGRHPRRGYAITLDDLDLPFRVHVVGLDSAWLCGDDHDATQIAVGVSQIDLLARDDRTKPLAGFRLALVHHPLAHLADGDQCRRLLADTVDLFLHGHQHDPIAEDHTDPDRNLRVIAAGSLYEGDAGDRWRNSFHVIDAYLDADGRPLRYEVEFWGWSPRGHWFRTGEIYRQARDGRLVWRTPLGETADACPPPLPSPLPDRAAKTFIGRERELDELATALLPENSAAATVAITAIEGMPGVGKSYLAVRFAYLHEAAFPGGIHWLVFDPETPGGCDRLGEDLCQRLEIREPDAGRRWESLRQRLVAQPSLVVVENVDSGDEATEASRFVQWLRGCRVLLTGRYRGLGDMQGWHRINVRPFDPREAFEQLVEEHRPPADVAEAKEFRTLVASLGFLPLAIHLAAGHLRIPGRTCRGFVDLLRKRGLEVGPADEAELLRGREARIILSQTFDISLQTLRECLGDESEPLLAAFHSLGHAPLCGCGRSLAAAVAGLDGGPFETLATAAWRLSMLEIEGPPARPRHVYRLHPLLAELLRHRADGDAAMARTTDWFTARLPEGSAAESGQAGWQELHDEYRCLTEWLHRVPDADLRRVERAGSRFAIHCGPFAAWAELCERGLRSTEDAEHQSDYLWTLGNVALSSGDVPRAEAVAKEKIELDRKREDDKEAALASGLIADILQSRGELDEALRIRREEELPVYERLGDVRSLLVGRANLAIYLMGRGEPDDLVEARRLLELALEAAIKMRLPEVGTIHELLDKIGTGAKKGTGAILFGTILARGESSPLVGE